MNGREAERIRATSDGLWGSKVELRTPWARDAMEDDGQTRCRVGVWRGLRVEGLAGWLLTRKRFREGWHGFRGAMRQADGGRGWRGWQVREQRSAVRVRVIMILGRVLGGKRVFWE